MRGFCQVTHQAPLPHLRLCARTPHRGGRHFQEHLHSMCPLSGPCPDARVHEASVFGGLEHRTVRFQVPHSHSHPSRLIIPGCPWKELRCKCSQISTLPTHSAPTLFSPAQPGRLQGYTKAPQPSLWCHHGALTLFNVLQMTWTIETERRLCFLWSSESTQTPWCHVAQWCQHLFPTPVLGKGLG